LTYEFYAIEGKYKLVDLTYDCIPYPLNKIWDIKNLVAYIDGIIIRKDGKTDLIYKKKDGTFSVFKGSMEVLDPGFRIGKYYIDFHNGLLFIESNKLIGRYCFVERVEDTEHSKET